MDDVERVFNKLVAVLTETDASRVKSPIEVAEIYQTILPYRRFRSELNFETNQDYEMAILRLLAGEGGFASMDPPEMQKSLADEAASVNPNPGAFREYAAARVYLNVKAVDERATQTRDAYAPPEPADPVPADETAPTLEEPAITVHEDETTAPTLPFTAVPDDPPPAPPDARASLPGITTFDPEPSDGFQPEMADACPSCTRVLPQRPDLKFCPFCGMDVITPNCRFCGVEVDADWTFCIACGRQKYDEE